MKLSNVLEVLSFKGKSALERPQMLAINSVFVFIHLSKPVKKRGLSAMSVLNDIITSVVEKKPYPNVSYL